MFQPTGSTSKYGVNGTAQKQKIDGFNKYSNLLEILDVKYSNYDEVYGWIRTFPPSIGDVITLGQKFCRSN